MNIFYYSAFLINAGLRDLVDFLPASLVAIISYFSAEVTRGIWKPVPMNGSDWPSPAAILQSVESEIKEILADVGVNALRCSSGKVCNRIIFAICCLRCQIKCNLCIFFDILIFMFR